VAVEAGAAAVVEPMAPRLEGVAQHPPAVEQRLARHPRAVGQRPVVRELPVVGPLAEVAGGSAADADGEH
jgi:hypothetical protein